MYTEEYFRQRVLAGDVIGFMFIVIITFSLWVLLLSWIINMLPKVISKNINTCMIIGVIPYLYMLLKFTAFWFN